MRTRLFFMFAAVIFAATFAGCSNSHIDGDWEPMKWTTDVNTTSGGYVEVPNEGGTYVFTCKNYSGIWLSHATEITGNEKNIFYAGEQKDANGAYDFNNITTTWAAIKSEEGKLIVTIAPNETATSRTLEVVVTAGDVFDYFEFRIQPSEE